MFGMHLKPELHGVSQHFELIRLPDHFNEEYVRNIVQFHLNLLYSTWVCILVDSITWMVDFRCQLSDLCIFLYILYLIRHH